MDKLKMATKNLADENYKKLATLFPNAVTETITGYDESGKAIIERAIDADVLRQEISSTVVDGKDERYQFTWPDKKKTIINSNSITDRTLRPLKDKSVDFETTENIYIEGDNLEVLKIIQETYLEKIKMIYIDPPYNTGNDFVYNDDFRIAASDYTKNSGQLDDEGNRLVQNTESNGRFHTDWLNMLYPRIKLARNLLREDGVIFISIDDGESDNLRKICNEIFGETNFVADLAVVNNLKGRNDKKYIARANERLLMYIKSDEFIEHGLELDNNVVKEYSLEDQNGKYRLLELRKRGGADTRVERPNMYYPFYVHVETGEVSLVETTYYSQVAWPMKSNGDEGRWRWGKDTASKRLEELYGKEVGNKFNIYEKDYLDSGEGARRVKPKSVLSGAAYSTDVSTKEYRNIMGKIDFSNPKSITLLSDLIIYATNPNENEIILDFFSGSSTTAHAVMKSNIEENGNRKFIMVQLPEKTEVDSFAYKEKYNTICDIAEERLKRTKRFLEEEYGSIAKDVDMGFRVLKNDTSNMKDVFYNPSEIQQSLFDSYTNNIKEDRTPEDLLFQVMLDLGVILSSKIEEIEIERKKVFKVADGFLVACFDSDVSNETVKAVAQMKPYYAVFRDSCMENDSVATNFEQIFMTYSPDTVRKVL